MCWACEAERDYDEWTCIECGEASMDGDDFCSDECEDEYERLANEGALE